MQYVRGTAYISSLDEIERIHGLYSPVALGFAAALACGGFTFLLGGGPNRNVLCFFRSGAWEFSQVQVDKASFYTLFGNCIFSSSWHVLYMQDF